MKVGILEIDRTTMFITRRLCLRSGRILSIVAAAITIVSMSSVLLFIYEQMKGTFETYQKLATKPPCMASVYLPSVTNQEVRVASTHMLCAVHAHGSKEQKQVVEVIIAIVPRFPRKP